MPKLNKIQIAERLHSMLESLMAGKEVAARDLKALLSDEQNTVLESAWAEQQALRKLKRARTKEEQTALGWKSKREVQIEIIERALEKEAELTLETAEQKLHDKEIRQARIFLDTHFAARDEGKTAGVAWNKANNALTQAKLPRLDVAKRVSLSSRDTDVRAMEEEIVRRIEASMTDDEREQLELLRDTERAERTERTRRTK